MAGVMLVKQRVEVIERWNGVFRDPEMDAVRRRHGLVVTGSCVDADDANTVIVVMDNFDQARQFAGSVLGVNSSAPQGNSSPYYRRYRGGRKLADCRKHLSIFLP